MKELILLIGPPGSGKTTYCEKFLVPAGYVQVSQDAFKGDKDKVYKQFIEALNSGADRIVIDRMNFNVQQRERWIIPAKNLGYKIIGISFCTPDAAQRAKARKEHQTLTAEKVDEVTKMFHDKYEQPYTYTTEKGCVSNELDEFYVLAQTLLVIKEK